MNFSEVKKVYLDNTPVKCIKDADGNILWSAEKLPPEYQRVEWIASNSNGQYFNTFVELTYAMSNTLIWECDMQVLDVSQPSFAMQGAGTYGDARYYLEFVGNANTNTLQIGGGHAAANFFSVPNDHQRHTYKIDLETGDGYVDSTHYTFTRESLPVTSYGYIFMFAYGSYNNKRSEIRMKCWGSRMWNGDTLIRDFIPCYRIADGVNGMYDVVEGRFYKNDGSGNFEQGADV